jgi:hypothetical protein
MSAVTPHVPMFQLPSYQRRLRPVAPGGPGIRFQSGAPLKTGYRRGRGKAVTLLAIGNIGKHWEAKMGRYARGLATVDSGCFGRAGTINGR